MMMLSAMCLVGFLAGVVGLSVLLVTNFRDAPRAHRTSSQMLDLAPPVMSRASWAELPQTLQHPLWPALNSNTGWLGVVIATPTAPRPDDAALIIGLARLPVKQQSWARQLEVVFESRSTGERVRCQPTLVGPLPEPSTSSEPLNIEHPTREQRVQASVVGFFVSRSMVSLPPAEYRVFAQLGPVHSNEQGLETHQSGFQTA